MMKDQPAVVVQTMISIKMIYLAAAADAAEKHEAPDPGQSGPQVL